MVGHVPGEAVRSFSPTPAVRRSEPAPVQAPPPEVAAEQPAVVRKALRTGAPQRLQEIQYRLASRKVELSQLRERTSARRGMLMQIQGELDQLSSPQDYLDNYEEIERLECLRAQLQRDQETDLKLVGDEAPGYQKQVLRDLRTLRGSFWSRLLSGSPCRLEAPQPGSPW